MDKKIEKKGWTWQKIAVFAVGAAAIGFAVVSVWRDSGTSRLNVESERLLIDTVQQGVFQEIIPVTGIVLPIKTVFIAAVEGGRVEEKFVEDGAMMQQGQSILRLSNPDLQLNYLNQEANTVAQINQIRNTSLLMEQQSLSLREQALDVEYNIDLFGKRTKRNAELYQGKVISKVDFEETEDQYENLLRRKEMLAKTIAKDSMFHDLQQDQMNSSLDLMRRNLTIAKQSLDNLIVKAPFNGQLSGLTSELGELIGKGENIAQIDDLTNYKIRARIDEFYISRIFNEQVGSFQLNGKNYRLAIKKIYPQVTNGSFEADLAFLDEVPPAIKRGQTVSIKLELSAEEQGLLLSRGSFFQKSGGNWVYVLDPSSSVAHKREIKLGRQNPNFYEVLEGLQPGEIVIVSSYDNFGDKDELILK